LLSEKKERGDKNLTILSGNANTWTFLAFLLYLGIVVIIGLITSRFSSSGMGEFFLGGRRMKSFVVALAAVSSGRSAWLVIAVSGMAFIRGASAIWAVTGYILMELFLFIFPGRRLRYFTEKMDNLTIPDYLESRLGDKTNLIRIFSLIPILVFMVAYVSAQFNAGGKTLASSFNLTRFEGVLITSGIVLFYTMMGGFLAVCLTDLIQAMLMIFALLILPFIAILDYGGLQALFSSLKELSPQHIDPFAISLGTFLSFIGIGLGSPGNPHILNKYMSIDDPERLKITGFIGTLWNVIMGWGAVYIGLAGRAFYRDLSLLPDQDAENIFTLLGSKHLHPFLFGLTLSAIFAAIMSTADSQLLVASSAIVRDTYQKILARGKEISEKTLVFWSRLVTLIITLVALVFGALATKLVFYLVLFAWGGLGAAFGPSILLSLYWKKLTKWGVIAGIISGTATEIVWYSIPELKAVISEWVPATLLSFITVVSVSLMTFPPENAERMLEIMKGESKGG